MPTKPRSPLHLSIGRKVRRLRYERGLTQWTLAERVGCSNHFISGIERGVDSPSLLTLERLAKALGTKVSVLVDEDTSPESTARYDLAQLIGQQEDPRLLRVLRDVVSLYAAGPKRKPKAKAKRR